MLECASLVQGQHIEPTLEWLSMKDNQLFLGFQSNMQPNTHKSSTVQQHMSSICKPEYSLCALELTQLIRGSLLEMLLVPLSIIWLLLLLLIVTLLCSCGFGI